MDFMTDEPRRSGVRHWMVELIRGLRSAEPQDEREWRVLDGHRRRALTPTEWSQLMTATVQELATVAQLLNQERLLLLELDRLVQANGAATRDDPDRWMGKMERALALLEPEEDRLQRAIFAVPPGHVYRELAAELADVRDELSALRRILGRA